MNKTHLHIDAYVRFLRSVGEIKDVRIDANERVLFESIILGWARKEPLTVKDAMGMAHLGSPATMHKRVKRLREMELVEAQTLGIDNRTKILVPSSKGVNYLDSLGRAMALSLSG